MTTFNNSSAASTGRSVFTKDRGEFKHDQHVRPNRRSYKKRPLCFSDIFLSSGHKKLCRIRPNYPTVVEQCVLLIRPTLVDQLGLIKNWEPCNCFKNWTSKLDRLTPFLMCTTSSWHPEAVPPVASCNCVTLLAKNKKATWCEKLDWLQLFECQRVALIHVNSHAMCIETARQLAVLRA